MDLYLILFGHMLIKINEIWGEYRDHEKLKKFF